ncbi:MAG: hypothetical protein CSA66_06945 [Proteobacteria bacterium]|nr:MAG: hypothetical protein CSA66_06945 [Pseudomonadota bacterium]
MRRRTPLAAAVSVVTALPLLTACTRTVYVVANPDGSYTELVEPAPDRVDDAGARREGDDLIAVHVETANDYVLIDGPDDVVYVVVDVYGADVAQVVERPPMNVALVLDRSGSMAGDKLDAAKAAAVSLLDDLADGDRVALLSYASDVTVELPSAPLDGHQRGRLERVIAGLRAVGGTDLGRGLQRGAAELMRGYDPADLNRVILLSDGRPTVGEAEPWRLETLAARWLEQGVSVTTMGIGVDYNEDLMTGLALSGGGNYYYVEHPYEMAQVFERELRGLGHTVARDLEVVLDLPAGVSVSDVYGYRWSARGDDFVIQLASLSAGERRRVLLALEVPATHRGPLTVARGELRYRDAARQVARRVALPEARVAYTRDARRVASAYHRPVVEKLERVRNARVRERVVQHLDAGDAAAASALVRARLDSSRGVQRALGGEALADEVESLEALDREVRAAPAKASSRYRHLRKSYKARALDAMLH